MHKHTYVLRSKYLKMRVPHICSRRFAHSDFCSGSFARECLLGGIFAHWHVCSGKFALECLLTGIFAHWHVCSGRFAQECLLTGMFAHRHVCSPACLLTGMFANLFFFLFSMCLNIFEQVSFNFFVEISEKNSKNFFFRFFRF